MNIYLIRHGQSMWQTRQDLDKNSELTSTGIKQSLVLNSYVRKFISNMKCLRNSTLDNKGECLFFSSPMKRSIQTIQSLGEEYTIDDRIQEADFHVSSKLPKYSKPTIYLKKIVLDRDYTKFKEKIYSFISEMIYSKNYSNIILYTHAGTIKTILRIIHNNDTICYMINNCSITKIAWYHARWRVCFLNNTSFLNRSLIT